MGLGFMGVEVLGGMGVGGRWGWGLRLGGAVVMIVGFGLGIGLEEGVEVGR